MSSVNPAPRGAGSVSALSWLALKARALRRYGPGFAVEVVIFWVMLEGFQQLNYGGRIIIRSAVTDGTGAVGGFRRARDGRGRGPLRALPPDLEGRGHPRRDRHRLRRDRGVAADHAGQLGDARRLQGLPARRAPAGRARGADGDRHLPPAAATAVPHAGHRQPAPHRRHLGLTPRGEGARAIAEP